jgi:hypothetical protein
MRPGTNVFSKSEWWTWTMPDSLSGAHPNSHALSLAPGVCVSEGIRIPQPGAHDVGIVEARHQSDEWIPKLSSSPCSQNQYEAMARAAGIKSDLISAIRITRRLLEGKKQGNDPAICAFWVLNNSMVSGVTM